MSNATQNCEFCQSPAHIWFNCPKKPDGWKPDRLKGVKPPAPTKVTASPSSVEREFKVTTQELADNFGVVLAKDAPPPTEIYRGRKKSTAARKDVRSGSSVKRALHHGEDAGVVARPRDPDVGAGTQAPPVDAFREDMARAFTPKVEDVPFVKRGRPRIHKDRKTYKADKERERRARLKAAKDAK